MSSLREGAVVPLGLVRRDAHAGVLAGRKHGAKMTAQPASGLSGSTAGLAALLPRELEVLRLRAAGNTNKAVAAQLFLAEQTVKNYQTTVYHKLGITTLVEAMNLLGWVKIR